MTRIIRALWAAAALVMATLLPAAAHKSSDAYLSLQVQGRTITGQWDIALRDLDYAIGLDSDNNGVVIAGEWRSRQAAMADYALSRLRIAADGTACEPEATDHLVDRHSDGAYEVLRFAATCPAAPRLLEIGYDLLFDLDPQHRGLLRVEQQGVTHTAIFSPEQKTWRLEGHATDWRRQIGDYLREGVWHIWTGYDHMLFLTALLLPAVLVRRSGRWEAVASFGAAWRDVLKIVTAFTLAHSLTLSLAALQIVVIPSTLVEPAIAASIVFVALENFFSRDVGGR